MLEDGSSAEIAVVGNDGVVGISLFMGGASTSGRAIVQSAGEAMRVNSASLLREFTRGGKVQHVLLRYTPALITQMTQTAVCNRPHSLDQQLCRWLLLSLDLLPSNVLRMTQELLASMLGVRRESVTEAAGNLQAHGIIRYVRGQITVLDRSALEARVCECYRVVRKESERLLPYPWRPSASVVRSFPNSPAPTAPKTAALEKEFMHGTALAGRQGKVPRFPFFMASVRWSLPTPRFSRFWSCCPPWCRISWGFFGAGLSDDFGALGALSAMGVS